MRRLLWLAAIAAVLGGLLSLTDQFTSDRFASEGAQPVHQDQVNEEFRRQAVSIAEKEGVPAVRPDHVLAGSDELPDGSTVRLWVTDPAANPDIGSRCYYLDGGGWGIGACTGLVDQVTLNDGGGVLIGSVGTWPASVVRLAAGGSSADAAVVGGFFLVPSRIAVVASDGLSLALLGADGRPIGVVDQLRPPGSATPTVPA